MPKSKSSRSRPARPVPSRKASADRTPPILREIFARTRRPEFTKYLADLLLEICRFDTTPNPDLAVMRASEDACFRVLERELAQLGFAGARTERRPIDPAIQHHRNYSLLHFTKTPARPAGLSAEETYRDRHNLLYLIPGTNAAARGQSVAVNGHIDVVAPFFPPKLKDGIVSGRGSCDDKGPVVAIIAALKVLAGVMAESGLQWNRNVVGMFVIEEETGGNGSLSLAIDRDLRKLYDSIIVNECAGLQIYPANRGAVWYKAALRVPPGVSPFEVSAFVHEEMEKEGVAIRAESRHPLFPQRPVQTCHGIIGPFGEHPSRICGRVRFTVQFGAKPEPRVEWLVRDCLDAGLAAYVGLYGDKTKVEDPATGRPLVARHYDFKRIPGGFEVVVHGATGHMGSIRDRDGAITKCATLIRSLVYSRAKIEAAAGTPLRLLLDGQPEGDSLILEGGQGFTPTHHIDDVMGRMRAAAERGAETCLRRLGRAERGAEVVTVSYEKLHNVAFDGDPDSPSMRHAIAAARACGFWKEEPVRGWTVSCDSRLFAMEYPGMDVLTFGPGELAVAHSDSEHIRLDDVRRAAEFLAVFLLRQTGTVNLPGGR
ncbi:MAG: M20/M25/M40 family metallo-hydrolase [Verrucomicrobia bacterium]|nr:M20/M25/M40 family metallo-hydrolase [Verrucomicrobiota bacterium]